MNMAAAAGPSAQPTAPEPHRVDTSPVCSASARTRALPASATKSVAPAASKARPRGCEKELTAGPPSVAPPHGAEPPATVATHPSGDTRRRALFPVSATQNRLLMLGWHATPRGPANSARSSRSPSLRPAKPGCPAYVEMPPVESASARITWGSEEAKYRSAPPASSDGLRASPAPASVPPGESTSPPPYSAFHVSVDSAPLRAT